MDIIERDLNEHEKKTLEEGLKEPAQEHHIAPDQDKQMSFAISHQGDLIGAVTGHIYHDWLYVRDLWVHKDQRGKGLGTQLLTKIENKAKAQGIDNVHLWTASFEAPDFYEKQGYVLCGTLENKPKGHDSLLYKKTL